MHAQDRQESPTDCWAKCWIWAPQDCCNLRLSTTSTMHTGAYIHTYCRPPPHGGRIGSHMQPWAAGRGGGAAWDHMTGGRDGGDVDRWGVRPRRG